MTRLMLLILLSGVSFYSSLYSQDNFIPGQITTLKKDVIQGFIDYQNWSINPKIVRFKKSENAETIEYKADKITSFKVKDEEYIGRIVNIDQNSFDYRELGYSKYPQITKDTIFLQTLYSGKKNLYYLFKENGRSYFFINLEGKITPLEYHKYLKLKNNQSYLQESKRYIGQLNYYFRDAREFQAIIQGLEYSKEEITALFDAYYNRKNSKFDFKKENETARVEFMPFIGVSNTNFSFGGTLTNRISNLNDKASIHPVFGISIDIILARNRGKWSFNNDILYTSHSASGDNFNNTIYSEIAFGYLKLNTMARYRYFVKSGSLFLNAGLSYGRVVSETNYSREESIFTSSEGLAILKIRKQELGLLAGVGYNYKRASLELRFEIGSGISDLLLIPSSSKRSFLIVGYKI